MDDEASSLFPNQPDAGVTVQTLSQSLSVDSSAECPFLAASARRAGPSPELRRSESLVEAQDS